MRIAIILLEYFKSKLRKSWNRKRIIKHQKKRRNIIIKYAKDNSPYYREIFKNKSSFSSLPVISKKEMMENFSSFNTKGIKKEVAFDLVSKAEINRNFGSSYKNISIGLSSGTSGNKGIFLASEKERALWAGNILERILPTFITKKTSIGLFLRSNNLLYETLNSKKIKFYYFDLSHPFDSLLVNLESIKPKILIAPSSVLRILADRKLNYIPEKIISCAEVLDPLDKKIIEDYFNKTVHQVYQCTEGFLGTTCEYGTLHINEDLVFIEKEYIDKKSNRFIPIITDLYRTTQPIIRYRLDDILVEKKSPCPCGSHFLALEKIEGRCDDILYFKKKDGSLEQLFPDFIRRKIILFSNKIKDYQVIQKSMNELSIYTEPYVSISDYLHKYFLEKGLIAPIITHLKSPVERLLKDKKRRIIRSYHV